MRRFRKLLRALSDRTSLEAFIVARFVFMRMYAGRYPLYWPDLTWLENEPFWQAIDSFGESEGLNTQRRFFLREAAAHCMSKIGGNTAECGVFIGLGSFLICDAHRHNLARARHYVFDSFEGLSPPAEVDGTHWHAGDLASSEEDVRRRLTMFDFVEYKKGWIPERFPEVAQEEFCFVHIDVDLADPTVESLKFFFPRLKRGGWIVLDDYGFKTCPGATHVVKQFVAETRSASLIELPAGGAALVRID